MYRKDNKNIKGKSNIWATLVGSQKKKIYKRYAWNTGINIYVYTSYYEIRYTVHNASALRQLGFYSLSAIESFSSFRFVTHYTMFRITSCLRRKCDMPNSHWISFFFIPSYTVYFFVHEYLPLEIEDISKKYIGYLRNDISKTLIFITVSKSSYLNLLRLFPVSWDLNIWITFLLEVYKQKFVMCIHMQTMTIESIVYVTYTIHFQHWQSILEHS